MWHLSWRDDSMSFFWLRRAILPLFRLSFSSSASSFWLRSLSSLEPRSPSLIYFVLFLQNMAAQDIFEPYFHVSVSACDLGGHKVEFSSYTIWHQSPESGGSHYLNSSPDLDLNLVLKLLEIKSPRPTVRNVQQSQVCHTKIKIIFLENSRFTCFMIKGIEFRITSYVCPSPVPIKPGRLLLEPISVNFRVRGKVLEWLVAVQNLKWRRNVCRVHNISSFSALHSALLPLYTQLWVSEFKFPNLSQYE